MAAGLSQCFGRYLSQRSPSHTFRETHNRQTNKNHSTFDVLHTRLDDHVLSATRWLGSTLRKPHDGVLLGKKSDGRSVAQSILRQNPKTQEPALEKAKG